MNNRISELVYRSIIGTLSPQERAELDAWIAEDPANANFVRELTDIGMLERERNLRRKIDTKRPAADMQRRIDALNRQRYLRYAPAAAAAAVIVFAVLFAVIWSPSIGDKTDLIAQTEAPRTISIEEIVPGKSRARLVSSEGQAVLLGSKESGQETDKLLTIPAAKADKVQDLCLDVPRGSEFKIVLEDSTEVWLNSASQLHYPQVFADNERRVTVTGEAYFSVKKDPSRPFYVESRGQVVRVYGTTFNIKAYPDEDVTYTTLETGSISLRAEDGNSGELYLSPGHQALYNPAEQKVDMKVVNTSVITGWRHGRFVFEEQPLENIMRDLSRWYDFEYEFADDEAKHIVFLGSIPRYADFKTAVMILEKSGGITFSIADNKVVVSTKKVNS